MDSVLGLFLTNLVLPLTLACVALKAAYLLLDGLDQ